MPTARPSATGSSGTFIRGAATSRSFLRIEAVSERSSLLKVEKWAQQ
jgi:hypothetical protein